MVKLITMTKALWGWRQEKHFQTNSKWKHTDGHENVDTKNNE
jgi:hypothetical protein